ncbi:MAG TPA: ATP-binding protein [Myxococcota bacterium]|nr:ATP-binding protein [Myxococcota bacterium]
MPGDVREPAERTSRGGAARARRVRVASPADAPALSDVQSVIAAGLRRLIDTMGCGRAAAWMRRDGGEPFVAAASVEDVAPQAPTLAAFAEGARLAGATDLGAASAPPALRSLALQQGFSAVIPVGPRDGEPVALLLVGGVDDLPGQVRPRTLAALGAVARHLAAPLEAAAGLARIARLDDGVRRLDRLAALGDLVAEIVHEVRNPLVSVKTFVQLLPERQDDPEFRTRFSEVVESELRRIERLLDVVLEHARPRVAAPPGTSTAVGPVLDSVAGLLAHRALEHGVALSRQAPPDLPGVAMSDDGLRQVVLNLALNAIDATRSGGSVRLVAVLAPDGVEVRVEDEGPGVPLALRERVFEPFFSTKRDRPGGLGLAISRRIVEEAGGVLAITDCIGGGSAFRFTLALAP